MKTMARCTCTHCRPWFLLRTLGTLFANLAVLVLIIAAVLVLLALYGAPPEPIR
jgi:hypothetical protein